MGKGKVPWKNWDFLKKLPCKSWKIQKKSLEKVESSFSMGSLYGFSVC